MANENEKVKKETWGDGTFYNDYINDELNSFRKQAWKDQVGAHLTGEGLKILDFGTGPGFFACILSEMGHEVTAVDGAESMLMHARDNAKRLGVTPEFIYKNINDLDYPDNTFDAAISRNVTWTLKYPEKVYANMLRMLKPGGKLIIYDANWHLHFFDDELYEKVMKREEEHFKKYGDSKGVKGVSGKSRDPERFKDNPLANIVRPAWDVSVLESLGANVTTQEDVGSKVYEEWEKELYGESLLFEICAVKA